MKKKYKITQLETYKRLRKKWKIKPGTKIHKDKRKKSRQQNKINLKKDLE